MLLRAGELCVDKGARPPDPLGRPRRALVCLGMGLPPGDEPRHLGSEADSSCYEAYSLFYEADWPCGTLEERRRRPQQYGSLGSGTYMTPLFLVNQEMDSNPTVSTKRQASAGRTLWCFTMGEWGSTEREKHGSGSSDEQNLGLVRGHPLRGTRELLTLIRLSATYKSSAPQY